MSDQPMTAPTKSLGRACPICGDGRGVVLHTFAFTIPDGIRLPTCYDLVCCLCCGFTFADTAADQAAYDQFYAEQSKYENKEISSGGSTSSWDKQRFCEVADFLRRLLPTVDIPILDIGCANGGLLLALRDRGFTSLQGLDPSAKCVENVRAAGLTAEQGGIFESGEESDRFGCVVISHVLEHLRDLRCGVSRVADRVASGGYLYVEVPDASRYHEYYKVPYYYFDCEHINHFESAALVNLLSGEGFEPRELVQKEISTSADDSRYPVISALFRKTGRSEGRAISRCCGARNSIEAYLKLSANDLVADLIQRLVDGGREIVIWGAGQYASRLLSNTSLSRCRIRFFVDRDAKKQGGHLGSVPVLAPSALAGHVGPVVVCAALHSAEIKAEIRGMGLQNEIVVLAGE